MFGFSPFLVFIPVLIHNKFAIIAQMSCVFEGHCFLCLCFNIFCELFFFLCVEGHRGGKFSKLSVTGDFGQLWEMFAVFRRTGHMKKIKKALIYCIVFILKKGM